MRGGEGKAERDMEGRGGERTDREGRGGERMDRERRGGEGRVKIMNRWSLKHNHAKNG